MRFAAAIFSSFLALGLAPTLSAQALQVDLEEFRRLAGEVADLRDANRAQQTRIVALQKEVDRLRDALRESQDRSTSKMGDLATREDLKKVVEQIKEVDERRNSDKKLILGEFENLTKALAQSAKTSRRREPENEPKNSEPEKPIEGTFLEYVVQPGDGSLSEIISNFNAELQKQGRPSVSLRQVVQANPKLKPDRIYVGQKLQLPVPDKKK